MKQFLIWETQHNIGGSGTIFNAFESKPLQIPYIQIELGTEGLYEIDDYIKWIYGAERGPHGLTIDFAEYLPDNIKDFFVYEKNGKKFLRWMINPLDKTFYKGALDYLTERNVPHTYFDSEASDIIGYRTSSKSVILEIPGTDLSFSFKTGTSTAGQQERITRPNPSRWAFFNRKLSDYYYSVRSRLSTLEVAWEAGAIMLPPISEETDNSINIRLMPKVSRGETYQMTGFVLKDDVEIKKIATKAGMSEKAFRREISYLFGKFLTEMNLVLGFRISSAHLQNVRFELDKNMKPTGKVIMLDLTDGKPIQAIFEINNQSELLGLWKNLVNDTTLPSGGKPNEIVVDPHWTQSELHYFGSDWLKVMHKPSLKKGVQDKLEELGTFNSREVKVNAKGEITFKFRDGDHLRSKFNNDGNCRSLVLGIIR